MNLLKNGRKLATAFLTSTWHFTGLLMQQVDPVKQYAAEIIQTDHVRVNYEHNV